MVTTATLGLLAGGVGTLGAIGLARSHLKFGGTVETLATLPMMIPELVLGMAYLSVFTAVGFKLGMGALVLTHTTFCIPYVFINVKSRLIGMDPSLSEAARDLGASPTRVLKDITLPLCAIGCETDHIAPWKYSWRGVAQMASEDQRFILSESGHIAGIVNPPTKKKYGHYTGSHDFANGPDAWREGSEFSAGSWWPTWEAWLAERSGPMVPARVPAEGLGPAPGSYVHERH